MHESHTNYAHIFVSAWSVRRMHNSSVDGMFFVSGCASKVVRAWFWLLNGSKKILVCVIHESACVVYTWSMRDYQCLCVGIGLKPCTSTDAPPLYHAWTEHVSRLFHWLSLTKLAYASTCAICQWFVSDCKWYVHCSCVIHAWFVSDFCPPTN